MKIGVSQWSFGFPDIVSAVGNLPPARWLAAGLCLALGLGTAVAVGRVMAPETEPARLVTVGADGIATSLPLSQVVDIARQRLLAPGNLMKIAHDLDLSGTGLFGAHPEEALTHAIDISASDAPHIVRLAAKTGDEGLDIVLSNYVANSLARKYAEASSAAPASDGGATAAGTSGMKFVVVAKASKGNPAPMTRIYQGEALVLGLLSALAILASGLGRSLRSRAVPVDIPVRKPAVVQRGILEQIDMLERMWPETGRTAAMPEASNDEPEQTSLKPARQIVLRMGELREEAQKAIEEPSEEAMENVLFDIQSLRDRILWIAGEQIRNRRFTSSSR